LSPNKIHIYQGFSTW